MKYEVDSEVNITGKTNLERFLKSLDEDGRDYVITRSEMTSLLPPNYEYTVVLLKSTQSKSESVKILVVNHPTGESSLVLAPNNDSEEVDTQEEEKADSEKEVTIRFRSYCGTEESYYETIAKPIIDFARSISSGAIYTTQSETSKEDTSDENETTQVIFDCTNEALLVAAKLVINRIKTDRAVLEEIFCTAAKKGISITNASELLIGMLDTISSLYIQNISLSNQLHSMKTEREHLVDFAKGTPELFEKIKASIPAEPIPTDINSISSDSSESKDDRIMKYFCDGISKLIDENKKEPQSEETTRILDAVEALRVKLEFIAKNETDQYTRIMDLLKIVFPDKIESEGLYGMHIRMIEYFPDAILHLLYTNDNNLTQFHNIRKNEELMVKFIRNNKSLYEELTDMVKTLQQSGGDVPYAISSEYLDYFAGNHAVEIIANVMNKMVDQINDMVNKLSTKVSDEISHKVFFNFAEDDQRIY
jgi:hypothetical protein